MLKGALKYVVENTIQTNELLENLQNYNGKTVNEIINELAQIPKQQDQLWSTIFLEHFNKVCKYEKEREKQKGTQSQNVS